MIRIYLFGCFTCIKCGSPYLDIIGNGTGKEILPSKYNEISLETYLAVSLLFCRFSQFPWLSPWSKKENKRTIQKYKSQHLDLNDVIVTSRSRNLNLTLQIMCRRTPKTTFTLKDIATCMKKNLRWN